MGIGDVTGAGAFKARYDQAVRTQDWPQTNINKNEFSELRELFRAAKGRTSLTDGQSEALAYVQAKDPALAKTLEKGGSYDDYMSSLVVRDNQGQALPGGWGVQRSDSFTPKKGTFAALPDDLKAQVRAFREKRDFLAQNSMGQKSNLLIGLMKSDEGRALEAALKQHGVSLADALKQAN